MKILLLVIFLFVVNCKFNEIVDSHGSNYLEKKQKELKINFTNKNDIMALLGPPSTKSKFDNDTWIYIERTRTRGKLLKLGRNVLLNNNILVLKFDKYGILEEKLFYDKQEMNKYKFTKVETENAVRRGSFVQSFVNSLRQKMRTNAQK